MPAFGDSDGGDGDSMTSQQSTVFSIEKMVANVKPAQELLRGLSLNDFPFCELDTTGSSTGTGSKSSSRKERDKEKENTKKNKNQQHGTIKITGELLRMCMSSIWLHFHDIVNTTIDAPLSDSQCLLACLDILRYALCSSILLKMERQRRAFSTQLGRIQFIMNHETLGVAVNVAENNKTGHKNHKSNNNNNNKSNSNDDLQKRQRLNMSFFSSDQAYTNEEWHKKLEVSSKSQHAALEAISEVYKVISTMKKSMELDNRRTRDMKRVVTRIQGGTYLLNDKDKTTRSFLMEGNLVKQGPSGKNVRRRIFLFSDRMLYTSRGSKADSDLHFKINGDLLLTTIKVSDVPDTNARHHNPNPNHTNSGHGHGHSLIGNKPKVPLLSSSNKHAHAFRIDHPRKSFFLFASTPEDKQVWMEALNSAIRANFEKYEM